MQLMVRKSDQKKVLYISVKCNAAEKLTDIRPENGERIYFIH